MEFAQVDTATMAAAAGAADFSVWALFWKADIIVKSVMIMLVVMMAIVMDAGDDDAYDYADVHVFLFAI